MKRRCQSPSPIKTGTRAWFHPTEQKLLWIERAPTPPSIQMTNDPLFGEKVCAAYEVSMKRIKRRRAGWYGCVGENLVTNAPTPDFFREQYSLLEAEEALLMEESSIDSCIDTKPTFENFDRQQDPANKSELEIKANYDVAFWLWTTTVKRRNGTRQALERRGLPVPPPID